MTITVTLDEAAAVALATIIRRLTPEDYRDTLATYGVDAAAWYRAVNAGSLADRQRRRWAEQDAADA